jgi:hypothetical protein
MGTDEGEKTSFQARFDPLGHVDCGTQAVTLPRQTGVHLIIRQLDAWIQLPE